MKIFGIEHKYSDFGISYGLPMWYIISGFVQTIDPIVLVDTMIKEGLKPNSWVRLTDGIMREQGFGTLLKALKALKCYIEVEDNGLGKTPGEVFNLVNRYIIEWPSTNFNIEALRPMTDILVYKGTDYSTFLKETERQNSIKVIQCSDPQSLWNLIKNINIRIYKKV